MLSPSTIGLCEGRTYGAIVVDLERQHVVDLLVDRISATVANWLRQRPGVEVIARGRSTEYARAVFLGAPAAVQGADRWHVLTNVRDIPERWLALAHAGCAAYRRCPEMMGAIPANAPAPSGPGAPRLPRQRIAVRAGLSPTRTCNGAT